MKLYYYQAPLTPSAKGWFKDKQALRDAFAMVARDAIIIRCAHVNIEPPMGYHKPNGELANDAIERVPTMKDLINALSP